MYPTNSIWHVPRCIGGLVNNCWPKTGGGGGAEAACPDRELDAYIFGGA